MHAHTRTHTHTHTHTHREWWSRGYYTRGGWAVPSFHSFEWVSKWSWWTDLHPSSPEWMERVKHLKFPLASHTIVGHLWVANLLPWNRCLEVSCSVGCRLIPILFLAVSFGHPPCQRPASWGWHQLYVPLLSPDDHAPYLHHQRTRMYHKHDAHMYVHVPIVSTCSSTIPFLYTSQVCAWAWTYIHTIRWLFFAGTNIWNVCG